MTLKATSKRILKKVRLVMVCIGNSIKLFMVLVLMAVCGCGPKGNATVGFLSDYSRLETVSDTTLRYVGPKNELGSYSKFIIDPVVVHFHDKTKGDDISSKELAELRQYMYAAVHNAILDSYDVVRKPGPGVARIRIALTDIERSSAALKIIPATKIAGGRSWRGIDGG